MKRALRILLRRRILHAGVVSDEDASVQVCRRRRALSPGGVPVRQRRDALAPDTRRPQLQV